MTDLRRRLDRVEERLAPRRRHGLVVLHTHGMTHQEIEDAVAAVRRQGAVPVIFCAPHPDSGGPRPEIAQLQALQARET